MRRRVALLAVVAVLGLAAAEEPALKKTTIHGKLDPGNAPAPVLQSDDGKRIVIDGDADTLAVLGDKRLQPYELEINGHYTGPDRFTADPSYTKNLWAWKDGKRRMVTYWCPICSIRTYTPGKCMCCQRETELDLRDPTAQ